MGVCFERGQMCSLVGGNWVQRCGGMLRHEGMPGLWFESAGMRQGRLGRKRMCGRGIWERGLGVIVVCAWLEGDEVECV
uniref:Uncharacterized protein n=1 Tax=Bartonella schoenbuchensis (strain DSM 13525 / NCTC 13165 / R1) TaxID=687861 RepID=E6Z1G5_BARSR|nr:hypothetical protein BARSC_190226 [Bartonella schoenbuchensis R1]